MAIFFIFTVMKASLYNSYFDIQNKFSKGEISFDEYSQLIMSWNNDFSQIIKAQQNEINNDSSRGGRLVKKKIVDKTGKIVTKWVRPNFDKRDLELNNILLQRKKAEQQISIQQWKNSLPEASEIALKNASKYAVNEEVRRLARNELLKRSFNLDKFIDMSIFPQFMLDDYIKRYDDVYDNLTEKENNAVIDYVVSYGNKINKKLLLNEKLDDDERYVAMGVERAINKSKFINDVILYNGLSFKQAPLFVNHIKSLQPGDVYENNAFVNSSLTIGNAYKFDDVYKSVNNLIIKIYASSGQNGLCVQKDKYRFLLSKKSKFQIIENDYNIISVKLMD